MKLKTEAFLKDNRLRRPIDLTSQRITLGKLLPLLRERSIRNLKTDHLEMQNTPLVIGSAGGSIQATMDGYAALWECRWAQWRDGYELLGPWREYEPFLNPQGWQGKTWNENGRIIADIVQNLPKSLKERMREAPGVPLGQLPESLSTPVKNMLQAVQDKMFDPGEEPETRVSEMSRDKIFLTVTPRESTQDYRRFKMGVSGPGIGSSGGVWISKRSLDRSAGGRKTNGSEFRTFLWTGF